MKTKLPKAELPRLKPKLKRFAKSLTINKNDATCLLRNTILKTHSHSEDLLSKIFIFNTMKVEFINTHRKPNNIGVSVNGNSNIHSISNSKPDTISNESTNVKQPTLGFQAPYQPQISDNKYNELAEKLNISIKLAEPE